MRFYYLTITLLLLALNLSAQTSDAIELSSEQIALIQSQGAKGVQTVFSELGIQIQDLQQIEEFASEAVSHLITGSSNAEMISEVASGITTAMAEIALAENIETSYIIEYASAAAVHGVLEGIQDTNINPYDAIKAASEGTANGAIQFAVDTGTDTAKAISAASSGSLAGAIEASVGADLDVIQTVEVASAGIISGAISASDEANINIADTVTAAAAGAAEGAIEASVKADLVLNSQIVALAKGVAESDVVTATDAKIGVEQTLKAAEKGLNEGTFQTIAGNGQSIRIFIAPIKDANLHELEEAIVSGVSTGKKQAGYIPIVYTPYEDDPTIRQVSPN